MPRPSALTGDPGEGEAQVAPPGSLMHREPCALQTPGAGLPGEDDPPVVRGGGGTLEVLGAGQAAEGQAGGRPVAPAGGGDGPPREADPDPEGLNPPRGPGSLTLKNVFCSHRESPFLSRSGSVLASPRECSPPLQLCGLQDGGRACLLIVSCVCGHHLPGFPLITLKKLTSRFQSEWCLDHWTGFPGHLPRAVTAGSAAGTETGVCSFQPQGVGQRRLHPLTSVPLVTGLFSSDVSSWVCLGRLLQGIWTWPVFKTPNRAFY
ncbi:uncharacterized protein LOC122682169 isoform X1 [Cervus elaphus]|uniref:uncharacterized protein LOC122682169 isoform X1 n=1 Tax=Cervus elaphus TaxID=9860 RepID=UPI001CC28C19|nr:uncharacterized protein LOC122682169 isoform X1 [Cervus elaphus]